MMKVLVIAFVFALSSAALAAERAAAPVVHFELGVKDLSLAKAFYSELLGWKFEASPYPDYAYILAAQGGIGGGLRKEPEQTRAFQGTTVYVQVESIRETLEHATMLGSTTVVPPIVIDPTIGSIAVITDPDRNLIGLFSNEIRQ
jgi:uncharacterized protein